MSKIRWCGKDDEYLCLDRGLSPDEMCETCTEKYEKETIEALEEVR